MRIFRINYQQTKEVLGDNSSEKQEEKHKYEEETDEENLPGKLSGEMLKAIMDGDKETRDDGKIMQEALDHSMGSLNPDMFFEQMVNNFSNAKNIYGKSMLRLVTGKSDEYLQKNIKIPEFQRELQKEIQDRIKLLRKEKLLDSNDSITDKGIELASLILYTEELDNMMPKGLLGDKEYKKAAIYGDKNEERAYKQGDRFKDISIRRTIKTTILRGHNKPIKEDIKVYDRHAQGQIYIVYALDASGSMKGNKISGCKKAGIALAFKAIEKKDKVGLMVFGKDVDKQIMPTLDFSLLLKEITTIRASSETDISKTLKKSIELFPKTDVTKHLVLITDAMPTTGKDPEKETLESASLASSHDITISVVGIKLDAKAKKLAKRIAEIGKGKLYIVKNPDDIDKIVIEDYDKIKY